MLSCALMFFPSIIFLATQPFNIGAGIMLREQSEYTNPHWTLGSSEDGNFSALKYLHETSANLHTHTTVTSK